MYFKNKLNIVPVYLKNKFQSNKSSSRSLFFFFHISLTCNAGINCALSVEFQKPQCDVSQILDVKFTQRRCCLVDTINFYVVSGTDIHDHAIVVITM